MLWGSRGRPCQCAAAVIPVLESLHRAEPNNEAYRAELVSAYRAAESAFIDSGMLRRSLANLSEDPAGGER